MPRGLRQGEGGIHRGGGNGLARQTGAPPDQEDQHSNRRDPRPKETPFPGEAGIRAQPPSSRMISKFCSPRREAGRKACVGVPFQRNSLITAPLPLTLIFKTDSR